MGKGWGRRLSEKNKKGKGKTKTTAAADDDDDALVPIKKFH